MSTPAVYITNLRIIVRFKMFREASNTGGTIQVQVGIGTPLINVNVAYLPFSQWTAFEFHCAPTGYNIDYGWVNFGSDFFYPVTGGSVYLSDFSVEESKGLITWQTAGSAYYVVRGSDNGQRISLAGNQTVALESDAAAMPIGSWFEVYNGGTLASYISISGGTLRLAGTATTGTRTLAQRALVTLNKVAATEWTVHGAGVT